MADFFKKVVTETKEFTDKSIFNRGSKISFGDLLSGNFLSKGRFYRHIPLFGLVIIFFLASVALRFSCESKIAEIDNLQKELRDVKHEALTLSSELLGKSKQSQIKFLLSQKDSSLNILDCPPFVIELY